MFPKIILNDLRKFPIKKITKDSQQPFIDKSNIMLKLNKEFQEKKNRFLHRLKESFEIIFIGKKLVTFYNYDFKDIVKELKKQKIHLSLVQQDEWEDYFNSYKDEINRLQAEINKTDKEIDQMVYKLYELNEEEIQIIENSFK